MSYPRECELPALAALSDQAAADAINAMTVTARQPVALTAISQLGRMEGWWLSAKASANRACQAFIEYYNDPRAESIDLDLPLIRRLFTAIVSGGILTGAQAVEIDALASVVRQKYPGVCQPGDVFATRGGGA